MRASVNSDGGVGQRGADLDASLDVRHLQLPAGVVVAVPSPQQHTVGLQVPVRCVVVGASQLDGVPLDSDTACDVVEAGEGERLVDVELELAFQHFIHGRRLPETRVGKTSAQPEER